MKIEQDRAGNWSAYWDDHEGRPRQVHNAPSAHEARRVAKMLRDAETAVGSSPRPPIMRYFSYEHLGSSHLRDVSRPFCELAERLLDLPPSDERAVALRKLLEAKDAAVRAALP